MKRKIGLTGKEVFAVGLGAMPLSLSTRPSEEEGIKVIHKAIELGVNFIDTANVYCIDNNDLGHNERLIKKSVYEGKYSYNEILVATKGGLTRPSGRWESDAGAFALKSACERSLNNLGTESIFLYQLHAPDSKVPFSESIIALDELKKEGKIQHIGLSNVNIAQIKEALKITRIETVQNNCNVFYKKDFTTGLVDFCKENNITFLPYSPVGGYFRHKSSAENDFLKQLAEKYNTSTYCIMLSWLLSKGENVLPIPGASKISSISDSVKAVNIVLEKDDIEKMNNLPNH